MLPLPLPLPHPHVGLRLMADGRIARMPSNLPLSGHLDDQREQLDDLFVMRKGEFVATCECWKHPLGREARLFAGEDMIAKQVCRSDAEIQKFGETWRQALGAKGWV